MIAFKELEKLGEHAREIGFEGGAMALEAATGLIEESAATDAGIAARLTEHLAFVRLALMEIEDRIHTDAGSAAFGRSFARALIPQAESVISRIDDEIKKQNGFDLDQISPMADALSQMFRELGDLVTLLNPEEKAISTIIRSQDALDRAARGEVVTLAVYHVAKDAIDVVASMLSDAISDAALEKFEKSHMLYLASLDEMTTSGALEEDRERLRRAGLKEEFIEPLDHVGVEELLGAVDHGIPFYAICVNLEDDEEFTDAFIDWIDSVGKAVTNRTVIVGMETWYEFLLVSSSPVTR